MRQVILWTLCLHLAAPVAAQESGVMQAAETPQKQPIAMCPTGKEPLLPTGFIFSAVLPYAVYSYNVAAPVVAVVEEDVKFLDQVVLPAKTRLVGIAGTIHTLDRVNIDWRLAVFPNGCELEFSGIALSADDGASGIPGKLERHEDSIAAQIALKSMMNVVASGASAALPTSSLESSLVSGFAGEGNQLLAQNMGKIKSLESIYIRERTGIRVFVLKRFSRNER